MLSHILSNNFVDALMRIPLTDTFGGRSSLLQGLPPVSLQRSEGNRRLDLMQMIQQIDQLGRIRSNGTRPLLVVASNALSSIQGWEGELTDVFEDVIRELEEYYGGELTLPLDTPPQLEQLLFHKPIGSVGQDFFDRAVTTARSVARLMLTPILHGIPDRRVAAFGTGWLIAPGLLMTNHHVVEARGKDEPSATYEDKCAQVEDVLIWFDFYQEQKGAAVECRGGELVVSNEQLDYALIRVKERERIVDREPLAIIATKPSLKAGDLLNIVQYPGGGPLKYAIRNNYYVKTHPTKEYMLHYLTDTEKGSSGSPVLSDTWYVLALHHAATPITTQKYDMRMQGLSQRQQINFYNEGIALHHIIEDFPEGIRQEIQVAQQKLGKF